MLLNDCQSKVISTSLELLWQQWIELGISAHGSTGGVYIIDPEALLLCTLLIGRYDPRLFDEMLDWSVRNERWIALQRLKNLSFRWSDPMQKVSFAGFCKWMGTHDRKGRWKRFSVFQRLDVIESVPFFLDRQGKSFPVPGSLDPSFAEVGLQRPIVTLRGLSESVPMQNSGALLVRLRAVFGLSPRAEVLARLLSREEDSLAGIAEATGYSRPSVLDVLSDFLVGGLISLHKRNNRKVWSVEKELFDLGLFVKGRTAIWVDWTNIYLALCMLIHDLDRIGSMQDSKYAQNSELLILADRLGDLLAGSGLENPFEKALQFETVRDGFEQKLDKFISIIGTISGD